MPIWLALSYACLAVWVAIVALPWQPFRTRERIAAAPVSASLASVTVIVPARNEARTISGVIAGLARQGPDLHVLIVDDESVDDTKALAEAARDRLKHAQVPEYSIAVEVIAGTALPEGWGGKLWALQQGLERCTRPLVLLLDADIALEPGVVPSLVTKLQTETAGLVSVMAQLQCASLWEKLLVPPFILFFKLLYPFVLVGKQSSRVAAAAGGCILVRTEILREVGAFAAYRDELIDDCTLARRVKAAGYGLWLGLSHDVVSLRRYDRLSEFWSMVSRTAFTQLRYSSVLLAVTTLLMLLVFIVPIAAVVFSANALAAASGAAALAIMMGVYAPVIRFYRTGVPWLAGLPLAAVLFLAMTWHSAIHYWAGTRAQWKSRTYEVSAKR